MQRIPATFAIAALLSACGGGGGSAGSGTATFPAPAPSGGPLKQYEGTWTAPCGTHTRETTTMAATNGGNSLQFNLKTDFYANLNCTGAVIATATYSGPVVTLDFTNTVQNASIRLTNGETVTGTVDVGSAVANGQTVTLSGTGVTSRIVDGKTVWRFEFSEGSADAQFEPLSGTGTGALTLRNGELWTLVPAGTGGTTFSVENRLTR